VKRRQFIRGTLSGVAATAAGCSSVGGARGGAERSSLADEEANAFVTRFDAVVAGLADRSARPPEARAVLDAAFPGGDALAEDAGVTLSTIGLLSGLSAEAITHDAVRERVKSVGPRVERAVQGMLTFLGRISDEQLRDVQRKLAGDPDLGLRVCEAFTTSGAQTQVPLKLRLQMRATMQECALRLRAQPIGFVDETLKKVETALRRSPHATAPHPSLRRTRNASSCSSSDHWVEVDGGCSADGPARDDGWAWLGKGTGVACMGLGGALTGLGVLIAGAGIPFGIVTGPQTCGLGFVFAAASAVAGALLIILGLFLLAMGGGFFFSN
jgi:hypothetical protein